MRRPSLPPAVAVMAKVPGSGPVKSRLHGALTAERATELYRCFLLDRLDAVAALAEITPVVAFTPAEARPALAPLAPTRFDLIAQEGSDLGERLSTLLTALLARGHAGAIAIDSDSPTLPMAYVTEAAQHLARGLSDVVLGPCEDGGYYLIGLAAPQPALFEGIPWSTDAVLALTVEKARRHDLSVHLLPPWFDVDTAADLRRLRTALEAGDDGPRRTTEFLKGLP